MLPLEIETPSIIKEGKVMVTVLVLNNKGGCGKTTIATNLASCFASKGRQTVLFDLDRQRSSVHWLGQRAEWRNKITAESAWSQRRFPPGTEWVIMDAPAQIQDIELQGLLNRIDIMLIPVLPSPIDIRAAADFIGQLILDGKIQHRDSRMGIIANRLRERTHVSQKLLKFLNSLSIPVVAQLRDTQNYLHAAERGIGIFEMEPALVRQDLAQWQGLVRWLERRQQAEVTRQSVPLSPTPG